MTPEPHPRGGHPVHELTGPEVVCLIVFAVLVVAGLTAVFG